MTELKRAIAAGHICLDVIPALDHLATGQFEATFKPGHLITVGQAAFSTGGPVSNTGLALHRLGIPTQLIAKVGDDAFGRIIHDMVADRDPALAAGIVMDESEATSYTVIISPPATDRLFLHCSGANDTFGVDDINTDLVANADLFHFGYPPIMRRMYSDNGAELVAVFQRAQDTGVTTSLDLAFPDPFSPGGQADWVHILRETLPYVDVFVPSIDELLFMLRRETYEQLTAGGRDLLDSITPDLLIEFGDEMLAHGAKVVLLKLGSRGAFLRTASPDALRTMGRAVPGDVAGWADQTLWAPCFLTDVVGTTGSGDATIAGFLSALLREMSPREAVTMAVAVGACNVEAADALSGLRSWEDTQARIDAGWERHPLDLSAAGWRVDDRFGVWSP